jgi:hypothetical protein
MDKSETKAKIAASWRLKDIFGAPLERLITAHQQTWAGGSYSSTYMDR